MENYKEIREWEHIKFMEPDQALELIMDEFGEELKRFIFTYTKNLEQAEDITQEVFVNVYLKLHTFNGNSSLRTWIYSIAINKCKDFFKSWYFRRVSFMGNFLETNAKPVHSPEEIVTIQAENLEFINRILSLPLKYREILILFYYKEFTVQEISQILNLGENTIKSRMHRGRKMLQKILSSDGVKL
jgi:RNA polymerase sigma-70 factor, ECF subfamily